jgi:hypothetical protein
VSSDLATDVVEVEVRIDRIAKEFDKNILEREKPMRESEMEEERNVPRPS